MSDWRSQQIGVGVSRFPRGENEPERLTEAEMEDIRRRFLAPHGNELPTLIHPDEAQRRAADLTRHTGIVSEHHGQRRLIGLRYESEIRAGIGLFEPGYNPVRHHFTKRAAKRRIARWTTQSDPQPVRASPMQGETRK